MKTVLIYDNGEPYESNVEIEEFDSKDKMISFINEKKIGEKILAAYEIYKEIKIKPVEKVTIWEADS